MVCVQCRSMLNCNVIELVQQGHAGHKNLLHTECQLRCTSNQIACFMLYLKINQHNKINKQTNKKHMHLLVSCSRNTKMADGVSVGQAVRSKQSKCLDQLLKNRLACLNFDVIFEFLGQFTKDVNNF